MRKIVSKQSDEKRRRINHLIVGGSLIFLMLAGIFGYSFQFWIGDNSSQEDSQKVNYNGFEFEEVNGFWVLNKEGVNYIFRYNPNQIQAVSSQVNSLNSYSDKPLYIYSENVQAESEIRTNLFSHVESIEIIENEPTINCEDNSLIIKKGQSGLIQDGNCVYITGSEYELLKMTDEFLFKVLGVRE